MRKKKRNERRIFLTIFTSSILYRLKQLKLVRVYMWRKRTLRKTMIMQEEAQDAADACVSRAVNSADLEVLRAALLQKGERERERELARASERLKKEQNRVLPSCATHNMRLVETNLPIPPGAHARINACDIINGTENQTHRHRCQQ